MGCTTKVTIGGSGTRVTVQGGAAKRVTLDKRTSAIIADRRPVTLTQPRNTPVDVTSRATTVRTGNAMGVQGPQGEPGVDVGSTPTISAESAESVPLFKGMPVALVSNRLRRATPTPPFNAVVGLVLDSEIPPGGAGRVQTGGPMEQDAAAWALVAPGGLSPDAVHYLAAAGALSPSAPTVAGQVVAPVGRATSGTEFVIDIDTQVHL